MVLQLLLLKDNIWVLWKCFSMEKKQRKPQFRPHCLIDRRGQQAQCRCSNAKQRHGALSYSECTLELWLRCAVKCLFSCRWTIPQQSSTKCLSKANMKVRSSWASDKKYVRMTQDCEKSKAQFHTTGGARPHKANTPALKTHQDWEKTHTSLWLRYARRQIQTLCMAHYQWVYGKITQPSDKLVVIDSELETYAPVEAEADGSRSHWFRKWHTVKKKIWAYWNNHTSAGRSRLSENLAVHLHIVRFTAAFVLCLFKSPVACQLLCGISGLFFFYLYIEKLCSPRPKTLTSVQSFIIHYPSQIDGSERLLPVF